MTATEEEILAHLDAELAPTCQDKDCDGAPAEHFAVAECLSCHHYRALLLCHRCAAITAKVLQDWRTAGAVKRCRYCGTRGPVDTVMAVTIRRLQ